MPVPELELKERGTSVSSRRVKRVHLPSIDIGAVAMRLRPFKVTEGRRPTNDVVINFGFVCIFYDKLSGKIISQCSWR